MPEKPAVSIVVPAFNEEDVIGSVLQSLIEECAQDDFEIIVVDDGSTDGTYEIAKSSGVRVIRHPYNKGYGAALKTGARAAKSDLVMIMDSDGQHNPKEISSLLEHSADYDMVVGARRRDSQFPLARRPGKKLMASVANYLARKEIPDLNSGFRVIKKRRLMEFMHILPNSFSFSTTITLAMLKAGYDVKYVPIKSLKREGRKSNVSFLRDGGSAILLIVRTIVLFDPLRVFAPVSAVLFLVGLVFGIYGAVIYRRMPSTSVIILLGSLLIFFFGVLADQVSALRRQMSRDGRWSEEK
jgi:glycosyltransferase involved in cell wall biosynthesis